MFLIDWYKEYLEAKSEFKAKQRELQYCESCETLKMQLATANEDRHELLIKLLELSSGKPQNAEAKQEIDISNMKAVRPMQLGWAAKRQMLESEDRAKARALRENEFVKASQENTAVKQMTVEDIEKELGVSNA